MILMMMMIKMQQGYLPDAMINYLALLGWNDGSSQGLGSLVVG